MKKYMKAHRRSATSTTNFEKGGREAMPYEPLVDYIMNFHDSHYLLPMAEKYDTKTWNRSMEAAWERMGLVERVVAA